MRFRTPFTIVFQVPARLISVFIILACADARVPRSSDAKQQGESLSTHAVAQGNDSGIAVRHFTLVSMSGSPVPVHHDRGNDYPCEETFYAGSYDIGPATWASWDSIARRCPPAWAFREREPSRLNG